MRLAQMLIPFSDEMPEVKKRLSFADPMHEICDLFGKSRWGGLKKGHVTDIERAVRIMPTMLPPTLEKCLARAHRMEIQKPAAQR